MRRSGCCHFLVLMAALALVLGRHRSKQTRRRSRLFLERGENDRHRCERVGKRSKPSHAPDRRQRPGNGPPRKSRIGNEDMHTSTALCWPCDSLQYTLPARLGSCAACACFKCNTIGGRRVESVFSNVVGRGVDAMGGPEIIIVRA